jgi:hypothetical protein
VAFVDSRRAGGAVPRHIAALAVLIAVFLWPALALAGTGPALLGSAANSTSLSGATSVAVSGSDAWTTAYWPGQLTAVDFSNPSAPSVAGFTAATSSLQNGSNVTISGSDAFVVSKNRNASTGSNDDGSGNSLTEVDISNPAAPVVVGSLHSAANLFGAYGIAVQGGYAFVASQGLLGSGQPSVPDTSTGSFSVIDVSSMQVVAHLDNGSLPPPWTGKNVFDHATSVAIAGHYAYVTAFDNARVTVVDISNPLTPTIVASLQDATNLAFPADLAVAGHYLYVAVQTGAFSPQFAEVDISNPANPTVVATLNSSLLYGAYRIRVRGDFAYVAASGASGVAMIDVSDPTLPRIAGSVTDPRLHKTTGLDLDSSGRYLLASSPYLASESNVTYPPFPGAGGPTDTGTISAIDLDPSPISISITAPPANPTTQSTARFGFSTTDSVSAVQCQLDGSSFGPCSSPTTQTYSLLSPGQHTFTVQATDAAGNTNSANYTWTIGTVPTNSSPPTIAGAATQGATLTASPGTWSGTPTPTYAYQWLRCNASGQGCTAISSAQSAGYVVAQVDVGGTLAVAVTASNGLGSPAAVSSAPTAVVAAGSSAPTNRSLPAVSGSATQGQTLTVTQGGWSGSPAPTVVDQWRRCDPSGQSCTTISGATGTSYVVQGADVGSTLEVLETATNQAGSASLSSAPTGTVTATSAPQNTASPTISGTPAQGHTLTVSTGAWSGSPAPTTFTYQWQRCDQAGQSCAAISGATAAGYSAQRPDVGATLRAIVTAGNGNGSASATSSATPRVLGPPVVQSPPKISGTAVPAGRLTGTPGTWTGYAAPSYAYRWERCNTHGEACSALPGQTASSYTVVAGDVGFTLRLIITAANSSGSASAISVATAIVRAGSTPAATSAWRAFLVGASQRRATLRIVIPAGHPADPVKSISISLPAGLRFARSGRRLTAAIALKGSGHRRSAFSAAITHGKLVLTCHHPAAGIQILISSRALLVSKSFAAAARRRHASLPRVTVVVSDPANQTTSTHLKLKSD